MKKPAPRHVPFYAAAVLGVVALGGMLLVQPHLAVATGANVFFACYLVLTLTISKKMTAAYLARNAAAEDEPVWIIFAVTIGAVMVSIASLFIVLNGHYLATGPELWLSLASVVLGWLTIHMMAALHYAHLYWRPDRSRSSRESGPVRGISFPETKDPEVVEFFYFSYVIGMTAQTSDVTITSTRMRRAVLVHALASFAFNTLLIAAAVNVAVSLGS